MCLYVIITINMEEHLLTYSIHSDLALKIDRLKTDPNIYDAWLTDGTLTTLATQSQVLLAECASDLETGARREDEKQRYESAFELYKSLLSETAIRQTVGMLQGENPDIDAAKQGLSNFLNESKLAVVESDIHRRLEISRLERVKERVTRTSFSRFLGSVALAGAFASGTYALAGVIPVGAALAVKATGPLAAVSFVLKPQLKVGLRKLGDMVKHRVNGSIDFYSSAELRNIVEEEARKTGSKQDPAAFHERLTAYHMSASNDRIAHLILKANLRGDNQEDTKSRVTALVTEAVDSLEESLDDFYGVRPKRPDKVTKFVRHLLRRDKET